MTRKISAHNSLPQYSTGMSKETGGYIASSCSLSGSGAIFPAMRRRPAAGLGKPC